MSGMKEHAFRIAEGNANPGFFLEEIAAALGGEVKGRAVLMPSPGCVDSDRSMVVFFSGATDKFFVYSCDGSVARARSEINAKLKTVDFPVEDAGRRTEKALRIWRETEPAAATLVERYLRSRALTVPIPDCIRFHPCLWHGPSRSEWPAMVALVTNAAGAPATIHRTWLDHGGRAKAAVDPNKMSLGPISGGAVRLSPASEKLCVGEGIETSMSAMVAGRAAWAAISAIGLEKLVLPEIVKEVTILVGGDKAGRMASQMAFGRWQTNSRRVLMCHAPEGKDLNDVLMQEG